MEIKVLDNSVNHYNEASNITILAFGDIKKNSVAKVNIEVEGVETSSLSATCGCSAVMSDEKNKFTLQYNNTHIVEPFAKTFILNYREGNNNKQAQIKLTGNIIN